MNRRRFLALGAATGGAVALGSFGRLGRRPAAAQLAPSVPTVDRLVLTNVVDNLYDVFAKAGKLDTITVQRTPLGTAPPLLAEHGLAFHLESTRDAERREILLDFSLTDLNLANNYRALGVDPGRADALHPEPRARGPLWRPAGARRPRAPFGPACRSMREARIPSAIGWW